MKGQALLGLFLSLLFTSATLGGCLGGGSESLESIPEWSAVADNNETYSKSSMIGTKHLMHFSASWCTPCRDVIHKITATLPEADYLIISTDAGDEGWENLNNWHEQVDGANDTQDVSAPFMSESELAKSVNIKNTPTIFLIDSNGEILARHIGIFEDGQEINEFWNSA